MKNSIEKIKNMQPKEVLSAVLSYAEKHTFTLLMVFAGVVIGLALLSVNNFTNSANESAMINGINELAQPQSGLNIDEEVAADLLTLGDDVDVTIQSNIASYRRSAFSNATGESQWVIDAAEALENYYTADRLYPDADNITDVLTAAGVAVQDEEDRILNQSNSNYSYTPQRCNEGKCDRFTLSAEVDGGTYQLGERDFTRREWVRSTADALTLYKASQPGGLYPNEDAFITELTSLYTENFDTEFVKDDPSGVEVNDDDTSYGYRGIDCQPAGCTSFVLRTELKDGALYFQQSL